MRINEKGMYLDSTNREITLATQQVSGSIATGEAGVEHLDRLETQGNMYGFDNTDGLTMNSNMVKTLGAHASEYQKLVDKDGFYAFQEKHRKGLEIAGDVTQQVAMLAVVIAQTYGKQETTAKRNANSEAKDPATAEEIENVAESASSLDQEIENVAEPANSLDQEIGSFLPEEYYNGDSSIKPSLITDESGNVKLYRSVSDAEYNSIIENGKFGGTDGTMADKWFTTTPENAKAWQKMGFGDNLKIIEITVPESLVDDMYFGGSNLDNIGPAYCASPDLIDPYIDTVKPVQ